MVLACTVNEECGFTGASALAESWQRGPTSIFPRRPDWAIVAEPTGLIDIDRRLPPGEDPAAARQHLIDYLAALAGQDAARQHDPASMCGPPPTSTNARWPRNVPKTRRG